LYKYECVTLYCKYSLHVGLNKVTIIDKDVCLYTLSNAPSNLEGLQNSVNESAMTI